MIVYDKNRIPLPEDRLKAIMQEIEEMAGKYGWIVYKGALIIPMEPYESPLNDPNVQRAMALAEYAQEINL